MVEELENGISAANTTTYDPVETRNPASTRKRGEERVLFAVNQAPPPSTKSESFRLIPARNPGSLLTGFSRQSRPNGRIQNPGRANPSFSSGYTGGCRGLRQGSILAVEFPLKKTASPGRTRTHPTSVNDPRSCTVQVCDPHIQRKTGACRTIHQVRLGWQQRGAVMDLVQ